MQYEPKDWYLNSVKFTNKNNTKTELNKYLLGEGVP